MSQLKNKLQSAVDSLKQVDKKRVAKNTALLLVAAAAWTYLTAPLAPKPEDATVMIVRYDGRSGGTGVVLNSSPSKSEVLTNAHVCGILARGGLVVTPKQEKHTVASYRVSQVHDLCLVTVAADLKAKTKVASAAAELQTPAKVAGHPALLPMVVTKGHYSDSQIINVVTGFKRCTKEEKDDPDLMPLCFFLGGIPIIRTYEAQVVTATIMPGSSGSAVYNSSGELTNLVFAGSGELGYAFTVPHGFVSNFLSHEVKTLEDSAPNQVLDISELLENRNKKQILSDLNKICGAPKISDKIKIICSAVVRDLEWRN